MGYCIFQLGKAFTNGCVAILLGLVYKVFKVILVNTGF